MGFVAKFYTAMVFALGCGVGGVIGYWTHIAITRIRKGKSVNP